MKQFITLLMIAFILSSCDKEILRGSGEIVTKTLNLASFKAVESHYDIDAKITYGATQAIQVTGYSNLLEALDVTVENGVLKLKYDDRYSSIRNGNVVAVIQVPDLQSAIIHGSGNVDITELGAIKLATAIHGSGDIRVNTITGGQFAADIYGSGNVSVQEASFEKANVSIHGSGNVKAEGLQVEQAITEVYGSGDIFLTVIDKLKATIRGSGNIYCWGRPAMESDIAGSGKLITR